MIVTLGGDELVEQPSSIFQPSRAPVCRETHGKNEAHGHITFSFLASCKSCPVAIFEPTRSIRPNSIAQGDSAEGSAKRIAHVVFLR